MKVVSDYWVSIARWLLKADEWTTQWAAVEQRSSTARSDSDRHDHPARRRQAGLRQRAPVYGQGQRLSQQGGWLFMSRLLHSLISCLVRLQMINCVHSSSQLHYLHISGLAMHGENNSKKKQNNRWAWKIREKSCKSVKLLCLKKLVLLVYVATADNGYVVRCLSSCLCICLSLCVCLWQSPAYNTKYIHVKISWHCFAWLQHCSLTVCHTSSVTVTHQQPCLPYSGTQARFSRCDRIRIRYVRYF